MLKLLIFTVKYGPSENSLDKIDFGADFNKIEFLPALEETLNQKLPPVYDLNKNCQDCIVYLANLCKQNHIDIRNTNKDCSKLSLTDFLVCTVYSSICVLCHYEKRCETLYIKIQICV